LNEHFDTMLVLFLCIFGFLSVKWGKKAYAGSYRAEYGAHSVDCRVHFSFYRSFRGIVPLSRDSRAFAEQYPFRGTVGELSQNNTLDHRFVSLKRGKLCSKIKEYDEKA